MQGLATVVGVSLTTTPTRPRRSWPAALGISLGFVALLWVLELVDALPGVQWDDDGIRPRTGDGLVGVLLAPLLHGGFDHLASNSLLAALLLFLVLLGGIGRGLAATAVIWLLGGLGTWLVSPAGTVHIGASGLVFGWLVYLVLRGFVARRVGQMVLGVVLLVVYGGLLWGVLPGQPGISWQGHLFGALAGAVAAYVVARPGADTSRG